MVVRKTSNTGILPPPTSFRNPAALSPTMRSPVPQDVYPFSQAQSPKQHAPGAGDQAQEFERGPNLTGAVDMTRSAEPDYGDRVFKSRKPLTIPRRSLSQDAQPFPLTSPASPRAQSEQQGFHPPEPAPPASANPAAIWRPPPVSQSHENGLTSQQQMSTEDDFGWSSPSPQNSESLIPPPETPVSQSTNPFRSRAAQRGSLSNASGPPQGLHSYTHFQTDGQGEQSAAESDVSRLITCSRGPYRVDVSALLRKLF